MPCWVSGLGHILGLLDRWFDSELFIFFATQLLMYYDIAAYSVFLQLTILLYYDIVT